MRLDQLGNRKPEPEPFPVSGFRDGRVIPLCNRMNKWINFDVYNVCSKVHSLRDFGDLEVRLG